MFPATRTIRSAAAVVALTAITGMSTAQAQANCSALRKQANAGMLVTGAVATGATTMELKGMVREERWHMANEEDKSRVLRDPSSHLHGLGSYHLARSAAQLVASRSCEAGAPSTRVALAGAAVSLAIGTAKEVVDGWYNGFSTTDLAVDAAGAAYAVMQSAMPMLQNVTPTMSMSPAAFSAGGVRNAAFEYQHQTFWLSANVHEMLPDDISGAWPRQVRLSLGRRAGSGGVDNAMIVGLDIDAATLPGNHPVWMKVKSALHNVRLPGPALVIDGNGVQRVALYF